MRAWPDSRVVQRLPGGSVSADGVFVADLQQRLESVLEVLVVALQRLVKEREGIRIGTGPCSEFGTSGADAVEGCKVLKDTGRIRAGERCDSAGQSDVLGLRRGVGQHHRRGRRCEVLAVVLTHAEDFRPCLIGHACPFRDVAQACCRIDRLTSRVSGQLATSEDANVKRCGLAHAPVATGAPISAVMKTRTSLSSVALIPCASPGYTFSMSDE